MPLPCITVPPAAEPVRLTLPGGAALLHQDLATVAQPALAPLVPLFDVIDTIMTVIGVVQAIPDALGPPPDPSGLIEKMPELAEKLGKLAALIPQASMPLTVVGLIDGVITALEQARNELVALLQQVTKITQAGQRASELGDPELQRLVDCAQEAVDQSTSNIGRNLGPVGGLLAMLRIFMQLIGGPEVPDLSSLDGVPLDQAMAVLDDLVNALRSLRDAVPLP